MTKFVITTESGSDLPKEIQERYDIRIIPMHVTMGTDTYDDGSIPVQQMYDYYDKTGDLPKTSGSTPDENSTCFQQINDEFDDVQIIHIAYSGVTTVSFSSANIAAQDFDNVHIVDSKNVTLGLSVIIEETAKFIEANPNTTPEEIVAFVEELRERVRFVFLPQTLVYLKAGGRVSNLAFHGARLLNIHPTIVLENGYLIAGKKFRGSFEKCLQKTINHFFTEYPIDPATVRVGGSLTMSQPNKDIVYQGISEYGAPMKEWFDTGVVISCHGGPGAFGIVGIEKRD